MTGNSTSPLRVGYSTATAASVADFVAARYALPGPLQCVFLRRGFNDTFEVRAANGERYVVRLSGLRSRGEADVASETEFLDYLDQAGVPVAAPVPARDGSLFTNATLAEGQRSVVVFRHVDGRSPNGQSRGDAYAQGVTLARIHNAADSYAAGNAGHYRLDLNHLLHRQVAAVLGLRILDAETAERFSQMAARLSAGVAGISGLSWTRCHGDCHGGNARIVDRGPDLGPAVFFDFDDGGPGYLAYDLSVYLWAVAFSQRPQYAMWHAFTEGYRSIRLIKPADFHAVHWFVPIRQIWLMGEYAGRVGESGRELVPATWLTKHVNILRSWEDERLSAGFL
jgi:Ser/Thr protein kinase RdoA (MazF antagonist)